MQNIFRLTIDITNYCNFDCKYCTLSIPYNYSLVHRDISVNDIKVIVMYVNKYLSNYKIDCCIRGGEPTLHSKFDEIINELKYIKYLNNLILLTNGSILLNNYNVDYSIFNELRVSIHTDTIQHIPYYLDIILNNIEFLLKLNVVPVIHIMKSIETYEYELNNLLFVITNLFDKYSIDTKEIEIVDTFSTINYINNNYDYSKVNSIYNQGYKKPVYYCRAIKITPDMTYHYSCELASNISIPINNIYLIETWKYIQQYLNKKIVCNLSSCTCPIFCYKNE